jgi:putative sterol carrier protein
VAPVTDPTAEFFDELGQRGHERLLQKVTGSARFDIVHGAKTARWLVAINKGDIAVSRKNAAADCVIRADRALFDQIATGKKNAVAAVLRGELTIEGDVRLLVLVQRLFPELARPKKRRPAGHARRQS